MKNVCTDFPVSLISKETKKNQKTGKKNFSIGASQVALVVRNPQANAGEIRCRFTA